MYSFTAAETALPFRAVSVAGAAKKVKVKSEKGRGFMSINLLNIRLDLFDGGAAGAGAGTGSGGGAQAAAGAGEGTKSGVNTSDGAKAETSPVSRRRSKSGAFDNVVFGKQPSAEGASTDGAVTDPAAGDKGNGTAKSTENTGAEAEKKADAPKSREDRRRAYEEFIKGEGKEFYAEDTQKIVSKRVNDFKAMEDKIGKLQPFMDALADKYNLSSDDLDGLMKAIQGDRDFFVEAAAEAGMDNPETYRKFREAQRRAQTLENAQKAREAAEEASRRQSFVEQKLQAWQNEADGVKAKYPSFDFEKDSADPQFMSMLRSGVSVEAAYRALHHDEILAGAVSNAKAETEKNLVDNIRAKGSRPAENGTSSTSGFTYKSDVSKLNKAERAEIARRAARGEQIIF